MEEQTPWPEETVVNESIVTPNDETTKSILLQAALRYAGLGWYVFPLHTLPAGQCSCGKADCSDAGKHPRTRRGLKDASRDPEQIDRWFGPEAPVSNIGIRTGEISNLTVLDIDTANGKKGAETWLSLIENHGEPDTLTAKTGSGGLHLFFRYHSGLRTSSNTLGEGVDCRNDNGYVVAAPSVHRSGQVYEWLNWGTEPVSLPGHLSQRKERRGRPRKTEFNRKYTLKEIEGMLKVVPADDRDLWRNIGVILGREFQRSDEAWRVYQDWSSKWKGTPGRDHDAKMREAFYEISQQQTERELSLGTIVAEALKHGWTPVAGQVPIENFIFLGPSNAYVYLPTNQEWTAGAVDAVVSPVNEDGDLTPATTWLQRNEYFTSMTKDPLIEGYRLDGFDCRDGEIIETPKAKLYNAYRRPTITLGDPAEAEPWLDLCRRLFNKPGDCDQVVNYLAHRVQFPGVKPRFALIIAGAQGVGKDTVVEMTVPAIGVSNVANIEPSAFNSQFNEFYSSTLVRLNEAANLQESNKWILNEQLKILISGTPEHACVNQKYGLKFTVRLHNGTIITTNHLLHGLYIPEGDRRYDVIACSSFDEMQLDDPEERGKFFDQLWEWFHAGGSAHVAAYLHERNLEAFNPNRPRLTEAKQRVIAVGMESLRWLIDVFDFFESRKMPLDAVRVDWIVKEACSNGEDKQTVRRKLSHSMAALGYSVYWNPERKDGRWDFKIGHAKGRTMVYLRSGVKPALKLIKDLDYEWF